MKKKISLVFIFTIIIVSNNVRAQQKPIKNNDNTVQIIDRMQSRVQFEVGFVPEQLELVKLDTSAVLLVYTLYDDQNVYINKYDNNLNKIYNTSITIPDKSKILLIRSYKQKVYLLLIDKYKGPNYLADYNFTDNYKMIEFNHELKNIVEVEGVFKKLRMVQDIIPCDAGVFMSTLECYRMVKMAARYTMNFCALGIPSIFGYTKFPYIPYLVNIDFKNKQASEQVFNYPVQAAILGVDLDEEKKELNLSVKNKITKNENNVFVANYKYDANTNVIKINENKVNLPLGNDFYSAQIKTINSEEKLVLGSFGIGTIELINGIRECRGLFLSKMVKDKCEFTTLLNMNDMDSYQKKNNQKKFRNTSGNDGNNRGLLFHNIIVQENQYIVITESYIKTIALSTGSAGPMSGYDGCEYDKLLVFGFSKKGVKLWEQSIDLPYYKSYYPNELIVRTEVIEGNIYFTLVQDNGSILFVKLNNDNTLLKSKGIENIENVKNEKSKQGIYMNGGVLYGNNYLVYGWEDVKEIDKKKNSKTVIFINKIIASPN